MIFVFYASSGPLLPGISYTMSQTSGVCATSERRNAPCRCYCRSTVSEQASSSCGLAVLFRFLKTRLGWVFVNIARGAHYSVTSSSTMSVNATDERARHCLRGTEHSLTKSSKPSSVPVNSRSLFMTTHIRDPIHRSINSVGIVQFHGVSAIANIPRGRICEAMVLAVAVLFEFNAFHSADALV